MARKVFTSFHYEADNWRVSQVKYMGKIEGNTIVSSNQWEEVKRGGDRAIQNWIDKELSGKSCTIVFIGAQTAGRKWINYEITKSWNDRKGVLGIHIHNLKDRLERQSIKGQNPFNLSVNGRVLSTLVKAYDPPFIDSKDVYNHIQNNIEKWIEEAIAIRQKY
jgi:hypothetical protein